MIFHLSFRLLLMNTVIYCQLLGLKFLLYSNRYFTIAGSLKSTLSSLVSNFRIIFQSVSVSSKLSMSKFSVMRNVRTDLGIATIPSSVKKFRTTWALVLPYFAPIFFSVSFVKIRSVPCASGPQAIRRVP